MNSFKKSVITRKLGALAIAGLTILAVGCGKARQGQYQGIESVRADGASSYAGGTGSAIRASAVITLQDTKSDMVQGTWSTRYATGTFTGLLKADQLQILNLTRTGSSTTSGLNYQSSYSAITLDPISGSISAICPGDYMGTLKFDGDRIVGSITPENSAMNPCSQIDIDVMKVN